MPALLERDNRLLATEIVGPVWADLSFLKRGLKSGLLKLDVQNCK